MDAEALKASGMLNMLMSAEGRDKLQALAGKVRHAILLRCCLYYCLC